MFVCHSVCLPRGVPMWPPLGPVQTHFLGIPPGSSHHTEIPPRPRTQPPIPDTLNLFPSPLHVQTCSLCGPYCRQAGGWHSTKMPSCFRKWLKDFIQKHHFAQMHTFKVSLRLTTGDWQSVQKQERNIEINKMNDRMTHFDLLLQSSHGSLIKKTVEEGSYGWLKGEMEKLLGSR